MKSQEAYFLGSMPRRLNRARTRSKADGDEGFEEVRRLAEQWLALLDAVKDQSIRPSVQQLLDRLALEQEHVEAQKRYRRHLMLHQFARSGNEGVPHPGEPPTAPTPAPDSLALASALVDRPEHAQIREKLTPDLRDMHEMGYLIAECRWSAMQVSRTETMRIWTLARKWNVEEWVTGRAAGTPLEPGETIERLVTNNANKIDEMLLSQPIQPPAPPVEELPAGPYLTIPEVAKLLKVGEDTVERLINSGQLAASEVSGKGKAAGRKVKRIRREAVEEFMKRAEGTVAPIIERHRRCRPSQEKDYLPDVPDL